MALIEVLIAALILGGVLVSMASLTARFVRVVTDTGARSRALQIAGDRLEAVPVTIEGGVLLVPDDAGL